MEDSPVTTGFWRTGILILKLSLVNMIHRMTHIHATTKEAFIKRVPIYEEPVQPFDRLNRERNIQQDYVIKTYEGQFWQRVVSDQGTELRTNSTDQNKDLFCMT